MTHDELLAKTDKWFEQTSGVGFMMHHNTCVRFDCDCGSIDDKHQSLHKAFRAVVELHKPDIQGRCDICSWIIGKPGYVLYEVCPTIQAIEKELA